MNVKFNGRTSDLSAMLVSAERYALGRSTYIVQWTCEIISKNLDSITLNDKKTIMSDIYKQQYVLGGYGMKQDKDNWLNLMKIIKKAVREEEDIQTKDNKENTIGCEDE